MIDPLEPRRFLTAQVWQSVNSEISAAAALPVTIIDTVPGPNGRNYGLAVVQSQLGVVAFGPDGHLDPSFAGGVVTTPSNIAYSTAEARVHGRMTVDRAGNVYVASMRDVTRFRPDGQRDRSFGKRGLVYFAEFQDELQIEDVLATTDGRILIAARTLRESYETFYLYEVTGTATRLAWSSQRNTGYDHEDSGARGKQDAYLSEGGGAVVLAYRSNTLAGASPGMPAVPIQRTRNDLKVVRFAADTLAVASHPQIELDADTDISDVRLTARGTRLEAVGGNEFIRFNFDRGTVSRIKMPANVDRLIQHTAFASDGSLFQVYGSSRDDGDDIYIDRISPRGSLLDRGNRLHLKDRIGAFQTLRIDPDDVLILSTTHRLSSVRAFI